jgi:hypothetical protein
MAADIYDTSDPRPQLDGSRTDVYRSPRVVARILNISLNLCTCNEWRWRKSQSWAECKVVGQGQMECSHSSSLPVGYLGDNIQNALKPDCSVII